MDFKGKQRYKSTQDAEQVNIFHLSNGNLQSIVANRCLLHVLTLLPEFNYTNHKKMILSDKTVPRGINYFTIKIKQRSL